MLPIAELQVEPFDVELSEPFGIATGVKPTADNALVSLTLADGVIGLGEAAPFPAVNGETRELALAAVERARPLLVGADARRWRKLSAELALEIPDAASARAAIEMALLDALCRSARLSLWSFFGGAEPELTTDITIVTGDVDHAANAAERATRNGFSMLKIKVGGGELGADVERVCAVARVAPSASLVLDANASLSAEAALELLARLGRARERLVLFEQPTPASDLDAARRVRIEGGVQVAADESVKSAADVAKLARADAFDVVNLKLTKSGVCEVLEMAAVARAHGIGLMIGGMVETRLAMSVSACLAAGLGGFSFVDLDTPMFLVEDPFVGGYLQEGARLTVSEIDFGHAVRRR